MWRFVKKSLLILVSIVITVTTCLSISAVSKDILDGYTLTQNMTDKADTVQANYQTANTSSSRYTTDLTQTVEWTDIDDGDAEINIYYSAEFEELEVETRVLYLLTNCTGHGFSVEKAAQNIVTLLEESGSDYVDVIIVEGTETKVSSSMFSISAAGSEEFTVERLTEIVNATDLSGYEHIYALGYAADEAEGSTGVVSSDYEGFGTNRHYGQLYFPQYLQSYYEIITGRGLDFSTTVQAIYTSFDGFSLKNGYATLDVSELGLNTTEYGSIDFSQPTNYKDAYRILIEYSENGRYASMITSPTYDYHNSSGDRTTLSFYSAFLIDPYYIYTNQEWHQSGESYTLTFYTMGASSYDNTFSQLGLLDVDYEVKTATITATIDSRFTVDETDITISIADGFSTSSSKTVTEAQDGSGDTIVIITLVGDEDDSSCSAEITIPITLKDSTTFTDGNNSFDEIHTTTTSAQVTRASTYTSGTTSTYSDTVQVYSTKLCKVVFYDLIFDVNGAQNVGLVGISSYEAGSIITLPDAWPIYDEGIVLIGWSETQQTDGSASAPLTSAPEEGILIDSVSFTNSNITVYAVYAQDRNNNGVPDYSEVLHLIYDMNGDGSTPPEDNNDYIPDDTAILADTDSVALNASGIVLIGWSRTQQSNGSAGNPLTSAPSDGVLITSGSVTFENENITVYAVYAVDRNNNGIPDYNETLHLSYDLNGGEGTEPTDTNRYKNGETATLDDADYSYDDLIFLGWSLDSSYSADSPLTGDVPAGLIIEGSVTFEDSNITVYAVWYKEVAAEETPEPDDDGDGGTVVVPGDSDNEDDGDDDVVLEENADAEDKNEAENVTIPNTSTRKIATACLWFLTPLVATIGIVTSLSRKRSRP